MKPVLIAAFASLVLAGAAHAAPAARADSAKQVVLESNEQGRGGCPDPHGLMSRAAFVVRAVGPAKCAQMLSTDTLLQPRHWDKT
jgi:hypothetical protein